MLIDDPLAVLWAATLALVLDAVVGDPPWLWRKIAHPVVLIGRAISRLEGWLLNQGAPPWRQRLAGSLLTASVVGGAAFVGWAVQDVLLAQGGGWWVLGVSIAVLLAQGSLVDHVRAVADGLDEGLAVGRLKVGMIVGRDPQALDEAGVSRASIESLAENLSDGVVAPLFWALLFGLPGVLAYKALNTADSMIGHRTPKYLHFGWASARLDDLANWLPARLTALLTILGAALLPSASPRGAARIVARDSRLHRSINAGWPEAAFAGGLNIRLSGPRAYAGEPPRAEPWVGDGTPDLGPDDVRRAIRLAWAAWAWAALPLLAASLMHA